VRAQARPLVAFSADLRRETTALKRFLFKHMYRHERVHRMTVEAREIIARLFDDFFEEPRRMPPEHFAAARKAERRSGKAGRARIVADYIAGMTDRYAGAEYERLTA